jgi:hypothetical protein
MKARLPAILALALASPVAVAHHGVASMGAAGLEGPGAPIETSSSATLPEGKWLTYLKVDHASYKKGLTPPPDDNAEADFAQYWMLGLGYGFAPWFSAYVFQPYNIKEDESDGFRSSGFTDLSLMGVIGFKYDDGFGLVPGNESLDDLMDWHFTLNLGMSLPTGDADHRLRDGSIDPGMSLGFGKPSVNYGLTATRQFSENATAVFEASQMRFRKYRYDTDVNFPAGDQSMRFGTETRINAALSYRLATHPESRFRLDGNIEANFLRLGRDESQDGPEAATGGKILYAVAGVRLYKDNTSLGLALKKPVWTELNEGREQQGAEGKEKYRFIATFSAML